MIAPRTRFARRFRLLLLLCAALALLPAAPTAAQSPTITVTDLPVPPGSGIFGYWLFMLPNGNVVVADPEFDAGGVENVGAVHLYDGESLTLISTLTGSQAGDGVGLGLFVLDDGGIVTYSFQWRNGDAAAAGAVTWIDGETGLNGVVSPANSLVGSSERDGQELMVRTLPGGAWLATFPFWDDEGVPDAGAVVWGKGNSVVGPVSRANSLFGSHTGDLSSSGLGAVEVTLLENGAAVVATYAWDNGDVENAGAITWVSPTEGVRGPIGAARSLVGSRTGDLIGPEDRVRILPGGDYVLCLPYWDWGERADVGAALWVDGAVGIAGTVHSGNALLGSHTEDRVCLGGAHPLPNGSYVVVSHEWNNGLIEKAGAVTWGSADGGIVGVVSPANSLVGSSEDDWVGRTSTNYYNPAVAVLDGGDYVVGSSYWRNPALDPSFSAGAVTWGSADGGVVGPVSAANSLVGCVNGALVGDVVTPLPDGNYVVTSSGWSFPVPDGNGASARTGAVTWSAGDGSTVGCVSPANSLVGSTHNDSVGLYFDGNYTSLVIPLTNGGYVVGSPVWDNLGSPGGVDAGAATWGAPGGGTVGPISPANSLVGTQPGDMVGRHILALTNGHYVVGSPSANGSVAQAGAATWGDGRRGVVGPITPVNSLVGTHEQDRVGAELFALPNGHYVVVSPDWGSLPEFEAGALTWGDGWGGSHGAVSPANSLIGGVGRFQGPANDTVITLLPTGNYVAAFPYWISDNGRYAGAFTLASGWGPTAGRISAANSLILRAGARYPWFEIHAPALDSWMLYSPNMTNEQGAFLGGVAFGDSWVGTTGVVSAQNSLMAQRTDVSIYLGWAYDPVHERYLVAFGGENTVRSVSVRSTPPVRTVLPLVER